MFPGNSRKNIITGVWEEAEEEEKMKDRGREKKKKEVREERESHLSDLLKGLLVKVGEDVAVGL